MKIELGNNYLMIIPETEFESDWLQKFKPDSVFHKTDMTASEYHGLKITAQKKSLTPKTCINP